jgi:hypothetical protein
MSIAYTLAGQYGAESLISNTGAILPSHSVTVCLHGTMTLATLYTDKTKGTGATNPCFSDAGGNLTFWSSAIGPVDITPLGQSTVTVMVPPDPNDPVLATPIVPANGYGITGNTGMTPTPAVGLTSIAGNLASDVSIPANTYTTVMTTASLGIGTWLITMAGTFVPGDTTHELAISITSGTAVGAFSGQAATAAKASLDEQHLSINVIATITGAGTVILQAVLLVGGTAGTAKASTVDGNYSKATGYTAVRIA